ncbi:MAG: T9SS type A sorting domain-containing protein [Bacteroidia bacterium]|nr:T9SS type A sorting domain-containing protein [Bacteroidia bacterium]
MKSILRITTLLGVSLFSLGIQAQGNETQKMNQCGTLVPDQKWDDAINAVVKEMKDNQAAGRQVNVAYTIPVIIHVIHGGQAVGTYPNLAAGQLISQIQTLNNDFAGTGYNAWNYPANAYTAWATAQNLPAGNRDALGRVKIGDCGVQFCLATKDTLGNTLAEPGIDRISYVAKGWTNPASFNSITSFRNFVDGTIKPNTVWNVKRYLNIWITDENISVMGLLGYATFPQLTSLTGIPTNGLGTATTDGYWCYSKAFGSKTYYPAGTYYSGNDRGRVSTHEIGHWLGLRHIWGDGNCVTDYCNDTPPAAASNFGTANYPFHSGTCAGNSPNGEMYMNFMDYTDDPVKYMFSTDQATRVQAAMASGVYRKFLGTHNLCQVAAVAPTASFGIATTACANAVVTLSNMTDGIPVPTYTWSANGPGTVNFNPNANTAYNATFPTPGTYTISLSVSNGSLSSITKVITIGASPSLTLSTPRYTVCTDEDVELTASGGNSFAWQPGSQLGASVLYSGMSSQVYTCVATGAGNCKTTSTISVEVQDCNGLTKITGTQTLFNVYPNPANDKLFVQLNESAGTLQQAKLEVMDALGKVIIAQNISGKNSDSPIEITISELNKGIYLIRFTANGKNQTMRMIKN